MNYKMFLINEVGAPVTDNTNSLTAGKRGSMLLEDTWYLENFAHFDLQIIPKHRLLSKGILSKLPKQLNKLF